jgi:hypothetical protein
MTRDEHYLRVKAKRAVRSLVRAIITLGYDEATAAEIAGCTIEEAQKDGINTENLVWAVDRLYPIRKTEKRQ